ncbi:hypothetical protein [Streptomyces lasiicapitis]|nr:hypothetical protein [Streptomyces lasiicapitis]
MDILFLVSEGRALAAHGERGGQEGPQLVDRQVAALDVGGHRTRQGARVARRDRLAGA